jgi:hypothetical protein
VISRLSKSPGAALKAVDFLSSSAQMDQALAAARPRRASVMEHRFMVNNRGRLAACGAE